MAEITLFKPFTDKIKEILSKSKEVKEPSSTKQNYADLILFNKEGQFLIVLRSRTDDFEPGKWALPGGKIEKDEESIDAAIRELKEETGIEIDSTNLYLDTLKEDKKSKIYYHKCYNAFDNSKQVLEADELLNYAWIKPSQIDDYDFLLDLGETLKTILIPQHQQAFNVIKKAFDEGKISDEVFYKAYDSYLTKEEDYLIEKAEENIEKGGVGSGRKPSYDNNSEENKENINFDPEEGKYSSESGQSTGEEEAKKRDDDTEVELKKIEKENYNKVVDKIKPIWNNIINREDTLKTSLINTLIEEIGEGYYKGNQKHIEQFINEYNSSKKTKFGRK